MAERTFVGLLGLCLVAPAAGAGPAPITLAEALQRAEEANPLLQAARSFSESQARGADAVARASWPRLRAASGFLRSDNPATVFAQRLNSGRFTEADFAVDRLNGPDPFSHLSTSLSLELPVDAFGQIRAGRDAQRAMSRAAEADARVALGETLLGVVVAYRQAAVAEQAVAVLERSLESARAREDEVQARVDEGAALSADSLRARARRREREADLAEGRSRAELVRRQLAHLLGAPEGTEYRPVEAAPEPQPLSGEESDWIDRALEDRAAVAGARARGEAASWQRRAVERSALPRLALFGQLQDDRNRLGSEQTWTVGASVSVDVLDFGRGARTAQAVAGERARELERRATADRVRLEVAQALRGARTARERYAAARGGAAEGREALRVVRERRQAGMATLTDELETEAASLLAELNEVRAAAEVSIADAGLWRAVGVEDRGVYAGEVSP